MKTSAESSTSIEQTEPLSLNVAEVVRQRLPRHARFIPRFVLRGLERLIHQDELNWLLASNAGRRDADFCRGVLSDLDVTYNIIGASNLPEKKDTRVVYVSNHPLGALDGIALIDMVARHHGVEPLFVVNDLLMALEPLSGVFLPVNKHGAQSHEASKTLNDGFAGQRPLIVFPAGLVSRRSNRGEIHDLGWRNMAVKKAAEYGRAIIPVFFDGRNSSFFYNFAKFRTRTGLKFNLEMVLLPGEVFKCRGRRFSVVVGRKLSPEEVKSRPASVLTRELCEAVYQLSSLTSESEAI